jgi:DNA-binding transcriptional regulator YdaS (Cro superfamily)
MEVRKQNPGIKRAIELFGTQTALARRIGVGQNVISYWLYEAKDVPPKRAVQIEAVSRTAARTATATGGASCGRTVGGATP